MPHPRASVPLGLALLVVVAGCGGPRLAAGTPPPITHPGVGEPIGSTA